MGMGGIGTDHLLWSFTTLRVSNSLQNLDQILKASNISLNRACVVVCVCVGGGGNKEKSHPWDRLLLLSKMLIHWEITLVKKKSTQNSKYWNTFGCNLCCRVYHLFHNCQWWPRTYYVSITVLSALHKFPLLLSTTVKIVAIMPICQIRRLRFRKFK